jgi:two-component system, chemotaxis family, chemotaxis protein CheY
MDFSPTAKSRGALRVVASEVANQLEKLKVLIVDDEPTMRKVTRSLLQAIGLKTIIEANDGLCGLDVICAQAPDVVIVNWEMAGLNGPEFVRRVRSPGSFPLPDVPIIMLTAYGERSRVVEVAKLGVNEFLLKPVSFTALQTRLVAILARPRRMVRNGDYYGPEPRNISSFEPECDPTWRHLVLVN